MNTETLQDIYKEEEFRDSMSTVDSEGKRVWVYPKKPKGRFLNARKVVSFILLTLLFSGPFIKIGGQPLLLFNLFESKFVIFGMAFWPQDFIIFVVAMISFIVFIVLFTVIYGRVWCGWACPQTIFMEMVFRKIEYWIEGDANQQRKLDKAPWNKEKILKKSAKHLIFVLISLLIAHTLMAYLIGIEEVVKIVSQPPTEHMTGFIGLIAFTGVFYWVFSWFREQACIAVCPYGRLQGVFLDKDSVVVAYDHVRGEARTRLGKKAQAERAASGLTAGDCVDCSLCVHVCPTGIDIRNGTQLECVNCTACIDACDTVMDKVGRDRGLIRFDSVTGIETGKKWQMTPRIMAYTGVLVLLLGFVTFLVATRSDIEATVMRVPGILYQEQPGNRISNLYNIQFVNKTFDELELSIKVKGSEDATIKRVGQEEILIPANENLDGTFFIEMPQENLDGLKTKIVLQLYQGEELIDEVSTNFLGPAQ